MWKPYKDDINYPVPVFAIPHPFSGDYTIQEEWLQEWKLAQKSRPYLFYKWEDRRDRYFIDLPWGTFELSRMQNLPPLFCLVNGKDCRQQFDDWQKQQQKQQEETTLIYRRFLSREEPTDHDYETIKKVLIQKFSTLNVNAYSEKYGLSIFPVPKGIGVKIEYSEFWQLAINLESNPETEIKSLKNRAILAQQENERKANEHRNSMISRINAEITSLETILSEKIGNGKPVPKKLRQSLVVAKSNLQRWLKK